MNSQLPSSLPPTPSSSRQDTQTREEIQAVAPEIPVGRLCHSPNSNAQPLLRPSLCLLLTLSVAQQQPGRPASRRCAPCLVSTGTSQPCTPWTQRPLHPPEEGLSLSGTRFTPSVASPGSPARLWRPGNVRQGRGFRKNNTKLCV